MKKRVAAFRAALLLLSLLFQFTQVSPEKVPQGFVFFRKLPMLSAPLCILLAIAAYVFYHIADRPDREQH
jgi:hypothetical protein